MKQHSCVVKEVAQISFFETGVFMKALKDDLYLYLGYQSDSSFISNRDIQMMPTPRFFFNSYAETTRCMHVLSNESGGSSSECE